MNNILLTGRLVHDPESKFIVDAVKTVFTIAVSSRHSEDNECKTNFFDCVATGEFAKEVLSRCKKGNVVAVKGYLDSNIIEHNNERKYVMSIVAERISIIEGDIYGGV